VRLARPLCAIFSDRMTSQRAAASSSSPSSPGDSRHVARVRVPTRAWLDVPYAPVSHPFVERLIGTIRREYLDRVFFWNAVDLAQKLEAFRDYYNDHRVHRALAGLTPAQFAGALSPAPAALDHYGWQRHCRGLFELPIAA